MPIASPWAMPESCNAAAAESAASSSGEDGEYELLVCHWSVLLLGVEAREAPAQTIPGSSPTHLTRMG